MLTLQEYDFELVHKLGNSMKKVDLLSRRTDYDDGKPLIKEATLLPQAWFRPMAHQGLPSLVKTIKELQSEHELETIHALERRDATYTQTEDSLVYKGGKLVIPDNFDLKGQIIMSHHDSPLASHPRQAKTIEKVQRSYYWSTLCDDVIDYVKGCAVCQRTKIDRQAQAAPLHPNPVPSRNWENISVDMITHLPEVHGHNTILVIVDMKSKDIIPIPTLDTLNSEGWANLLIEHVICMHGIPQKIVSDHGSIFVSMFIKDLYKKLHIKGAPSTAHHPQTDGQTERINQEVENYLQMFINYQQTDWPFWLPLTTFKYRNQTHSATGHSPFYLTHGYHPFTGVKVKAGSINESARQYAQCMKKISETAAKLATLAQKHAKKQWDKHKQPARQYNKGDLVYLDLFHITTD